MVAEIAIALLGQRACLHVECMLGSWPFGLRRHSSYTPQQLKFCNLKGCKSCVTVSFVRLLEWNGFLSWWDESPKNVFVMWYEQIVGLDRNIDCGFHTETFILISIKWFVEWCLLNVGVLSSPNYCWTNLEVISGNVISGIVIFINFVDSSKCRAAVIRDKFEKISNYPKIGYNGFDQIFQQCII